MDQIAAKVAAIRHKRAGARYASPHEGYGFLAEEFAELLDEIRRHHPRRKPNPDRIAAECVDIAAIAVVLAEDVVLTSGEAP